MNLATPSTRLTSIDAYRGMVMILMMVEIVRLSDLGSLFPDSTFFRWLTFHTTHVPWSGGSLHDLIQPSFTFLVGVAMPFSIASRIKRGHTTRQILTHAAWRSFALIALGIGLRSIGHSQIYFTFEDTLTQIGLGYLFVVAIALKPHWVTTITIVIVLMGFWGAYAVSSPPPSEFDYSSVGVPADWSHHHDGFASRWNKNSNLSWQFDTWFLNLFPREEPFTHNEGGYATLSFIPTMATMLLGLIAGRWLRDPITAKQRITRFAIASLVGLSLGYALSATDICPNVKRIWTPAFALHSSGWLMAWMGVLHAITDVAGWRRWCAPMIVVGANSILAYVMTEAVGWRAASYWTQYVGRKPFSIFGDAYANQMMGLATLSIFFLMLWMLYRRRWFIRI